MEQGHGPVAGPAAASEVVVNGEPRELAGPRSRSVLATLRLHPGKPGCGEGECGPCTVLLDGASVLACQTRLAEVAGRSVTTIEGLAPDRPDFEPVGAGETPLMAVAPALGSAIFAATNRRLLSLPRIPRERLPAATRRRVPVG